MSLAETTIGVLVIKNMLVNQACLGNLMCIMKVPFRIVVLALPSRHFHRALELCQLNREESQNRKRIPAFSRYSFED